MNGSEIFVENNVFVTEECTTTRWHIGGIDVCKSCWMLITTVSSQVKIL